MNQLAVADPGFPPGGGAPTPKNAIIFQFFPENCMKMKEFGPPGGGGRASLAPPLDPPMIGPRGGQLPKRFNVSINDHSW